MGDTAKTRFLIAATRHGMSHQMRNRGT